LVSNFLQFIDKMNRYTIQNWLDGRIVPPGSYVYLGLAVKQTRFSSVLTGTTLIVSAKLTYNKQ